MAGIIEKIKNFFSGKFCCKAKKPAQPPGEEPKPQEEEPQPKIDKTEESKTKENSPF